MKKKIIVILLVTGLLTGCIANESEVELEKLTKEHEEIIIKYEEEKAVSLAYTTELEGQILAGETNLINEINEDNKVIVLLKDEIISLKEEILSLKNSINEYKNLTSNDIDLDGTLLFEKSIGFDIDRSKDDIISNSYAKRLYNNANQFHRNEFRNGWDTFSTKEEAIYYYEDGSVKPLLEHWHLANNNGKTMTLEDFDEIILSYYTEDVLDIYHKDIVDLDENTDHINYYYSLYENTLFTKWIDGGSDHDVNYLYDYLIIELEHLSETEDSAVFRLYIPKVTFIDQYSDNSHKIVDKFEFVKEIIELKKTPMGWRLNGIPKTYKDN